MLSSVTAALSDGLRRAGRFLLGGARNPLERGIFHKVSLAAFFAWVGLGADGLSSSCYGPEEAFLALGGHTHFTIFLALATALTVSIIAASYSQIIEFFPSGGGGYIVATHLLNPTIGLISGCALVVDYILTIAVSVTSAVDALLSFFSHADSPLKLYFCLVAILLLVTLNLRGVKESVRTLMPIFLLFIVTHALLIVGTFLLHADRIPGLAARSAGDVRMTAGSIGLWATLVIFLRAFVMGAGTYTGIEAVSNGLPILREPRVQTGRRTMLYMAVSLALTAGGILLGYDLFQVQKEEGRTLNATLFHSFAEGWGLGGRGSEIFIGLALLAEGMLLIVAAQAGFTDGPRVLASMAVDRWVPNRFANISSRLVTANGVLFMGISAAALVIYTRADIRHLVVMYSINVFVTFTFSQLGMVRHWWQVRRREQRWWWRFLINGGGLVICAGILVVTVSLKFFQGGWATLILTGGFIALAWLIRRHYRRLGEAMQTMNVIVENPFTPRAAAPALQRRRTVAVFVNRYDGLALSTLARVRALIGPDLRKLIYLSVAQVDSDQFRSEERVQELQTKRKRELERLAALTRESGLEAEVHLAVSPDVVESLEELAVETAAREPEVLFIAGQVVFERETIVTRLLHNEVAFALQRRLIFRGLDVLVLPLTLPQEARER